MIRVHRPTSEPVRLVTQRTAGLKRVFAALNAYGVGSDELKAELKLYDGGKKELFLAQHRKCAYCERRPGFAGNPVEHFRPKSLYWWLTWTWENHLFACTSCNSGHKGNAFPLAVGTMPLIGPVRPFAGTVLTASHTDITVESPLLVDPSSDDPLDHIEWRPVNPTEPKTLWKWFPNYKTQRGKVTIATLGLEELADDIGDHIREHVLSRAEEICQWVDTGNHPQAVIRWSALVADVAVSNRQHAGPTWNALHYLVDESRRRVAGLVMPARP